MGKQGSSDLDPWLILFMERSVPTACGTWHRAPNYPVTDLFSKKRVPAVFSECKPIAIAPQKGLYGQPGVRGCSSHRPVAITDLPPHHDACP